MDEFTSPAPIPSSRSRLSTGSRRLWHWLRAVVLRLEAPGAGEYDSLRTTLDTVQQELTATQVELAITKARLKAAMVEVQLYADIVSRDRARIASETAGHEVTKAKAIASAGDFRRES